MISMSQLTGFDVLQDWGGGWRGRRAQGNTVATAPTKAEIVRETIAHTRPILDARRDRPDT
jgi:hypothetical protein